ncbi:MAG: hypothetical protein KBS66_03280 [Eubacterium sp.]|nr:hypothetical protein [Candidatus Colimonas fimequi]
MKPLFFALLKSFANNVGREACRADVQAELKDVYGGYKAFKDKAFDEALMTACSNGIIHEARYELDEAGNLVIFYACTQEEADVINSYIAD